MTSALRLSTAGRSVSEGNDVGVSDGVSVAVEGSVGVKEAVCVAAGVNDSVGGWSVFVDAMLVGTEGGVKLQANIAKITRVRKMSFRFMGKVCIPFQKNRC